MSLFKRKNNTDTGKEYGPEGSGENRKKYPETDTPDPDGKNSSKDPRVPLLVADHLVYEYSRGTDHLVRALDDVSFSIKKGEFIGLIGHTGSGKSTLVQHLNALLSPVSGTVYFKGEDVFEKGYDRKKLRSKVGLVFQYPEHQLFEETVFADVCFGPKNIGMSRKQAELTAYETIKKVGLPDECFYHSPFDLSGGQKRRVAIAGVLAMKPELLVLDEPTAGLDPKGRDEILTMIDSLRADGEMAIVLVSHSMEDVAQYADRIMVIEKGKKLFDGTPHEVFSHIDELDEIGLAAPEMSYVMRELKKAGIDVNTNVLTIPEARDEILKALG
ncbi:MAG: energy-coupling factor transporter ATPase [Lachnospiraceae bacterium]|nr:energy-coupling factor transporter ATPase [Lachnospiraceae bacterium]